MESFKQDGRMRIKESIEKNGDFWLPSSPENSIPGTIKILDGGKIDLELAGVLPQEEDHLFTNDRSIDRIVGRIEKYGYITLDRCFNLGSNFDSSGISRCSIMADRAYLNVAFDEKEEILFSAVQFSVEGLDGWLNLRDLKFKRSKDKKKSMTITYTPQETISFNLDNGMVLSIVFNYRAYGFDRMENVEAHISQKAYFRLESIEERPVDDFISTAHRITTLLCLAIDRVVSPEDVTATSDKYLQSISKDRSIPVEIELIYSANTYQEKTPKISWIHMLFLFPKIKDRAEEFINNWLNAHNTFKPSLDLYFTSKTGGYKYVDGKFLALVQGLESYHRRNSSETLMTEKSYAELKSELSQNISDESKEWLKRKFNYGNELPLRKRLQRLFEPYRENIGSYRRITNLIDKIVVTRNYLTHYDKTLEEKALKGPKLHQVCLFIEGLFQLHFLKELGFSHEEIQGVLKNNSRLWYKLAQG